MEENWELLLDFKSAVNGKDSDINSIELQPLVLSGRLSPVVEQPHIGGHSIGQSWYGDDVSKWYWGP